MTVSLDPLNHEELIASATVMIAEATRLATRTGLFDTIGIDAITASANELVTVGARPMIARYRLRADDGPTPTPSANMISQPPSPQAIILRGLELGARQIDVPLEPDEPGSTTHEVALLVGATVTGIVRRDRLIDGQSVQPGDIAIGSRSSGLHGCGIGRALIALETRAGYDLNLRLAHLRGSIAEELLRPSRSYGRAIDACLDAKLAVRALINLAEWAWLGLARIPAEVGFDIYFLPEPQPIFHEIEKAGGDELANGAMFEIFNMGVGFVVVVAPESADAVMALAAEHSLAAFRLGEAIADADHVVRLRPRRLTTRGKSESDRHFEPE